MKKILLSWLLMHCISGVAQADSGKPLRVISLSPHTTELAFEAGLGANLVGVSAHSDYPPAAKNIEQVADYRSINIERILELQPDLVLAWQGGNQEKLLNRLKALGIKLFYSKPSSLEETAKNIEKLGQLSQAPEKAMAAAAHIRQRLAQIARAQQDKPKVRYFYQLGKDPLTTNSGAFWPQPLFTLCGGVNIFADSDIPYPQVGIEQIIMQQPEAIFIAGRNNQNNSEILRWQQWQTAIPAVKNNALFVLHGNWLHRPSSRALDNIEPICEHFDSVRRQQAAAK